MYKVGSGSVLRSADADQYGTGQLDRVSSVDDRGRRFADRIRRRCQRGDYIDFANTVLYVKAKITRADGTNLAVDSSIGPRNLFLHSLFLKVDVSLNGTIITASTNTCPYRSVMETLLSYGEDAKRTQLTSGLFYKDSAGRMDSVDLADIAANDGLVKRRALGLESRTFDMMGRLHSDIFFQDRYMINEVGVKIKLTRSKDDFCLMGAMAGKVQIVQASMFVRKVKLMPSVFLAHAKTLERSPAKYPIRRVVCKSFTIPQNYLDVSHKKLFSGQLPTRIVIGLVDNRAYNGDRQRNPFNFQHFNLNEIAVYLDGQQQHAARPVQPDYGHGLYIRDYNSMFAGTGKLCKDEGLHYSRRLFRRIRSVRVRSHRGSRRRGPLQSRASGKRPPLVEIFGGARQHRHRRRLRGIRERY